MPDKQVAWFAEQKKRSGDCEYVMDSERRVPDQHRANSFNTGWVKVPVKFLAFTVVNSEQGWVKTLANRSRNLRKQMDSG
jgi:hypothetical protein